MGQAKRVLSKKSATELGSTPFFLASAKTSARDSIAEAIRKLPHSFTTFAPPGSSAKSKIAWLVASRIGFTLAFAATGPDVQNHAVLAATAAGRPNTGV